MTSDELARSVFGLFAFADRGSRLESLGNGGGFSGARCGAAWRTSPRIVCAWPVGTAPRFLHRLHDLMNAAVGRGLDFVPAVCAMRAGPTWLERAGRLWELTHWLPGQADFHVQPTLGKLRSACAALARLHTVWQSDPTTEPSPAVFRRLRVIEEWRQLLRSGWRPRFGGVETAVLDSVAERAWNLLPVAVERLPALLEPWRQRPLPLQFCLCDVWHDHLLYEGETLTGLVDYGAVKLDHVAVDLARMLGSLVGDDRGRWEAGLRVYREVRPLTAEEEALATVLDRSGTVLGAVNWLRWLYHDGRRFEDLGLVARRLKGLVGRIEIGR